MGSSISSGHYADDAHRERQKPCPKGGEHEWEQKAPPPSRWDKCKKCGTDIYSK